MTKSKRVTHGNGHKFSNEKITHVQGPILSTIQITSVQKKKKLGFVPLTCLCLLDELPLGEKERYSDPLH